MPTRFPAPGHTKLSLAAIVLFAPLAAGTAGAHYLGYAGGSDAGGWTDAYPVLAAPECPGSDLGFYPGILCYGPRHIQAGPDGTAHIFVKDDRITVVSGIACQDWDLDHICGEVNDGEMRRPFCEHATLSPEDRWDPGLPVIVILDGPTKGNWAISTCVSYYSGSTTGVVWHT